jgi:hypothetical protein
MKHFILLECFKRGGSLKYRSAQVDQCFLMAQVKQELLEEPMERNNKHFLLFLA